MFIDSITPRQLHMCCNYWGDETKVDNVSDKQQTRNSFRTKS